MKRIKEKIAIFYNRNTVLIWVIILVIIPIIIGTIGATAGYINKGLLGALAGFVRYALLYYCFLGASFSFFYMIHEYFIEKWEKTLEVIILVIFSALIIFIIWLLYNY
jgi:hypothetical protein